MKSHMKYLKTLRRVPDDVILAVGSRDIDVHDNAECLCGWVVREHVARLLNVEPESLVAPCSCGELTCPATTLSPAFVSVVGENGKRSGAAAQALFGGTVAEWNDIWSDVSGGDELPRVEYAFMERVKEAAGVTS